MIKKALFPAAGYGTRFLPTTKSVPKEMLGLGHAVLTGESLIGNNPFAVVLADDLCEGDVLSQMVKFYNKFKCTIVAIEEVPKEEVNKYGVIAGRGIKEDVYMVEDMVEKPEIYKAPSNLAIIGRYILIPDIFEFLRITKPGRGREIQLTDALLKQERDGMVIGV